MQPSEVQDRDVIEIELTGRVPSKKNMNIPRAEGSRKGGKGFFRDPQAASEIDYLSLQIPGDVRDLKLRHPRLELHLTIPHEGEAADQDGKYTTLLDVLVKMGVLYDDNIRHFNGMKVLHPVVIGTGHSSRIVLTPAEDGEGGKPAPRYVRPKRTRNGTLASLSGSVAGLDAPPLSAGLAEDLDRWLDDTADDDDEDEGEEDGNE